MMEFLSRPVYNPHTAAWLCGLIRRLRDREPRTECGLYARTEVGDVPAEWYEPATELCPAWYAFRYADGVAVAIDGSTTLRQLSLLIDGYTGVLQSGFRDPENPYLLNAGAAVRARLLEKGLWYGQSLKIAGWSLGGAIAQWVPVSSVERPYFEPTKEVVTFGSPRPGGESNRRAIQSWARVTRYMNSNDPVPLCPPRTDTFQALPLIIGIRPALRWSNFVQPSSGMEILADDTIRNASVPSLASISFPASFVNWWFAQEQDALNDHWIGVYQRRLEAQTDRNHTQAHQRITPPEPVQGVGPADMRRADREAYADVVAFQQRQAQEPLVIPPTEKFKHEKIGRLHVVTFQGKVVLQGTNKRKAIGVARDLNSGMKRLQNAAFVDPDAILQALSDYFAAATDPNGNFSPPMNTSWLEN